MDTTGLVVNIIKASKQDNPKFEGVIGQVMFGCLKAAGMTEKQTISTVDAAVEAGLVCRTMSRKVNPRTGKRTPLYFLREDFKGGSSMSVSDLLARAKAL